MKEKHLHYWKKERTKGKLRFVILRGILGFGIPLAIVMPFVSSYTQFGRIKFNDIFFSRLWTGLIIYAIGGVFFGLMMWKSNEETYKKYLEKNPAKND